MKLLIRECLLSLVPSLEALRPEGSRLVESGMYTLSDLLVLFAMSFAFTLLCSDYSIPSTHSTHLLLPPVLLASYFVCRTP